MKYLIFFFLLPALMLKAQAQDTSAYNLQRVKVNSLLAQRSAKFGQYDVSLSARTGIFGLQTKRDIKNSNEILREIVMTDNAIFTELKVLMDYKDMQSQQIQDNAATSNSRIQLYRQTIKKLQDQDQQLKEENKSLALQSSIRGYFITFLLLGLIASAYIFYKKFKRLQLK